MALARKCDICGVLYEDYGKTSKESNGFSFVHIDLNDDYYSNDTYDCCPDCLHSIRDRVESLKKKGEKE